MYSGGLDSTAVLIAFRGALRKNPDMSGKITILTTPEAHRENPVLWEDYVRPTFRLINATTALSTWPGEGVTRVQGEHADQLFGSDKVFTDPRLITDDYNEDNLRYLIDSCIERKTGRDLFMQKFSELAAKSPEPIAKMRDLLWWINFTCKWQSVAFRTLAFNSVLSSGGSLSLEKLNRAHGTFFNTDEFQLLAMNSNLMNKWGDQVNPRTYKQAARDFIRKEMPSLADYCANKVKVGSLYNVIRQRSYGCSYIGIDEDNILRKQESVNLTGN
jgi:hypothetical protein